jgi:steroid 5-alpha reductase family enzyme
LYIFVFNFFFFCSHFPLVFFDPRSAGVSVVSLCDGFSLMDAVDTIAMVGCLAGLVIAGCADAELRAFVALNERRALAGRPTEPLLDTGTWRYSRHPNYFGEQLFHWSFALLAFPEWEAFVGTFINSIVLAIVTVMTERRMLESAKRAAVYRAYTLRTSAVIPWFPSAPAEVAGNKKKAKNGKDD